MSNVSELRMNVAALKRVDPYVKDILETATHVALYTFNAETSEWEKTDVEGALFVYSRSGEPFNSFLIMNRFVAFFFLNLHFFHNSCHLYCFLIFSKIYSSCNFIYFFFIYFKKLINNILILFAHLYTFPETNNFHEKKCVSI